MDSMIGTIAISFAALYFVVVQLRIWRTNWRIAKLQKQANERERDMELRREFEQDADYFRWLLEQQEVK